MEEMIDDINKDWEYLKDKMSKRSDFGKDAEIWYLLEQVLYYIERITKVI